MSGRLAESSPWESEEWRWSSRAVVPQNAAVSFPSLPPPFPFTRLPDSHPRPATRAAFGRGWPARGRLEARDERGLELAGQLWCRPEMAVRRRLAGPIPPGDEAGSRCRHRAWEPGNPGSSWRRALHGWTWSHRHIELIWLRTLRGRTKSAARE